MQHLKVVLLLRLVLTSTSSSAKCDQSEDVDEGDSSFMQAVSRQSMSRTVPDQSSNDSKAYGVLTFVDLATEVDLHSISPGWGNCSYPGLLIPTSQGSMGTASVNEPQFVVSQVVPQKEQAQTFSENVMKSMDKDVLEFYDQSQAQANETGLPPTRAKNLTSRLNVQGSNDGWQTDSFAAELIENSMLATFLEETEDNVFVLDLNDSGSQDGNRSTLQTLKYAAVRQAPLALLRCKGFLTRSEEGAVVLTEIKVLLGGDNWISVYPEDGTTWSLAKIALHSIALFTLEVFHTALHVYSAEVTAAFQNAVPKATLLGELAAPQTLFVLAALIEQMGSLHNDHPSAFNANVWACNLTELRGTVAEIARFFLSATSQEILGIASKPSRWAGGAASFLDPIEVFAKSAAQAIFKEAEQFQPKSYTQLLGQELRKMGMTAEPSTLGLDIEAGLAAFYGKTLFLQSIWHSAIFGTRELLSPLGLPSTQQLAPFLAPGGVADCKSLSGCLSAAIPVITSEMFQLTIVLFDTGMGYGSPPELGEGPYAGPQIASFSREIAQFHEELDKVRAELLQQFGLFTHGHFKPGYYYPKCQPHATLRCLWKPYGYDILATICV